MPLRGMEQEQMWRLPPTLDDLLSLARLIGSVHHQDEKGESPTRRLLSKNYYDLFKDNLVAE